MPVGKLKGLVTEKEFREYAAHLAHEPTVNELLNFWFSQVVAVLVNTNRAKGKPAVKAADLIPDRWALPETKAEKMAKFKQQLMGFAALGGR